tara:strand:- start:2350 stop:2865 length:516 start_codon:yes stop_codon:yes gene_type:complete
MNFIQRNRSNVLRGVSLFLFFFAVVSFKDSGNVGKYLPDEQVKALTGEKIDLKSITKPAVISFWSTTCIPCIKELNAINSKYDQWKKGVEMEVYAISTDDARYSSRVPALVDKKQWKFPVFTDHEKKLFKVLNVSTNPYTIVVNTSGKIVYEHNSYKEGDEKELIKIIKEL